MTEGEAPRMCDDVGRKKRRWQRAAQGRSWVRCWWSWKAVQVPKLAVEWNCARWVLAGVEASGTKRQGLPVGNCMPHCQGSFDRAPLLVAAARPFQRSVAGFLKQTNINELQGRS